MRRRVVREVGMSVLVLIVGVAVAVAVDGEEKVDGGKASALQLEPEDTEANLDGCETVRAGMHYSNLSAPQFNNETDWGVSVWFDKEDSVVECDCSDACEQDWSKLWGKSRCGYLHYHHWDSNRFVWRVAGDGMHVELAAYAYDEGNKPYQDPTGNLLQPFDTLLEVETDYSVRMLLAIDQTEYRLYDDSGTLLETHTILLDNHCENFNEGYLLKLYYGGDCTPLSDVSVCYKDGY